MQIDIVRAVIAAAAAALHRLDLGETGFPEAQHMLRQVEILATSLIVRKASGLLSMAQSSSGMSRHALAPIRGPFQPAGRATFKASSMRQIRLTEAAFRALDFADGR